jgi:hypothetical protein
MIKSSCWFTAHITRPYIILYSYLMGVQAIDQNIFPRGIGKDQSVLLPEVNDRVQYNTLVFPNTEGKIVWSIACTPIK